MSAATAELAGRAQHRVLELNRRDPSPSSLEGLARYLLRSEALASSQIEGLSISHRKLAQASIADQGRFEAQEILATMAAMDEAIAIGARSGPIEAADIADIHRRIAIVAPLDRIAGIVREEQSWIGGASPPEAEFVGPPWEAVLPLVADLCTFLNRDDLPAVVQAAIAHAQFETIHPFGDGNGRVGRCLIHVVLRRRGIAPSYVPPVSLVLGANKDAYIAGLTDFQEDQVERWTAQFARAVEAAAREAEGFGDAIKELQSSWISRAEPMRSDAAARVVIANLPAFPYITAAIVQRLTGKSNRTAITALEHLGEAGILTRHRNQRLGDAWEAKELFVLLERFEQAVKDAG